jgi:NAD-dependent dihydropyrimidine dehydrogenase PreA subunit
MQKRAAFVTERCTGCAGAPVCRIFCPCGALEIMEDRENFPFKRMQVNADSCTGCGSCVTRGPQGARILGCPWNAIRLTPV